MRPEGDRLLTDWVLPPMTGFIAREPIDSEQRLRDFGAVARAQREQRGSDLLTEGDAVVFRALIFNRSQIGGEIAVECVLLRRIKRDERVVSGLRDCGIH